MIELEYVLEKKLHITVYKILRYYTESVLNVILVDIYERYYNNLYAFVF